MPNLTTNFGLYEPLVNNPSDQDLWGGYLNTNFGNLDTLLLTCLNWTPSASQTSTITVTIPTAGSATTGSAKTLYLCNATGGAFAANLPAVATASGMTVAFKKTDSSTNAITITGNSSDLIDGSNTYALGSQYSYVVLACDGTHWDIIASTPPVSKSLSIVPQIFLSGGTYMPSANMVYCEVTAIGSGAGGGSGSANSSGGGGGGAGEQRIGTFSASSIGASQTVTIGVAGSGGTAPNGTGGSGNVTSLGSLISANGGTGGAAGNSSYGAGGVGGSGGSGGVSIPGCAGQAAPSSGAQGGVGGNSMFGAGGVGTSTGGTGNTATGYGAGGGGANGNNNGGAGTHGIMLIKDYCYS